MLQLLAMVVLGVGVPVALVVAGCTTWQWLGAGAAAWGVAVAIKAGLHDSVVGWTVRWGERATSAVSGAWSGVCELGVVAFVLLRTDTWPTLQDVVGIGVGAGSFEVLFVTWLGTVGDRAAEGEQFPLRDRLLWLEWPAVRERFWACVGHLAGRGLVWIGLSGWHLAPAGLLPLVTFTIVDGVAYYGHIREWDWSDRLVLRRFHALAAIVAVIESAVFLALLPLV